ncbi:MAG: choice-of-anchor V domain-containing protein [Saprospiraceae bacterium]|nr:choice-of-anchor V domain-containing protein [Saprospiraceae bacterium]
MKQFYSSRLMRVAGLALGVLVWLANSGNPPTGVTGAPFDSGTCNNCHSGGAYSGTVSISGLPSTIEPNTTYPMEITLTAISGNPVRGGYQLVVVDGNNQNAGDLITVNGQSGTEFFNSREYIEQRGSKTFSGGSVSWLFNWKSPVSAAGNTIKFYFIGNFCNGNGGTSGDIAFAFSENYAFSGAPPLTVSITNVNNVSCFGGNNGSATAEPSGGTPPYTYQWSNGQNGQTAVNLSAGTYTVTVTGASGSGTATASVTITQPPLLTLSASSSNPITCLNPISTLTATAGGGTPPYSFQWSNGQTGNPIQVSTPGSYAVIVTDSKGCTRSAQVTVMANITPPNANAGPSVTLTCSQPLATLNGAGSSSGPNFSYQWTASNGGNIVSGANTLNPVVNAAGTYTLVVTNNVNGCTSSASTTATSNQQPPTAVATAGVITCAQSSATVQVSTNANPANFSWTGPNNFSSNQQSFQTSTPGTYTVTVTNPANGCTKTATASVTTNTTAPTVSVQTDTLTCAKPSITLTTTTNANPATFAWAGPGGFTSTQQNPSVSVAGTYSVTVTNGANGCTNTAAAVVAQDTVKPTASAAAEPLTCADTLAQLTLTTNANPATFAWSGPQGFSSTQKNPQTTVPGTYSVVVTKLSNGCTNTASTTVAIDTVPPTASVAAEPLTCADTLAQLTLTTNADSASFAWSGPQGFSSTQKNPQTTVPGAYSVVVTNLINGCTNTASATVVLDTVAPIASIAPPLNFNCQNDTLQLDASASSQGQNFAYLWTTPDGHIVSGDTTLTPLVDSVGSYILLVTNTLNGCVATDTVTVVQSPPVEVSVVNTTPVSCFGQQNGSAIAAGSGGVGPFAYVWSSGDTTATAQNLAAGTYFVSVTDSEGCSATTSVEITQPAVLQANASATGETGFGANDGTATAEPTGGTAPYTYAWNTGDTTATITGLAPGVYTVTVQDANGCTAAQTVTVNSFNCSLTATISATPVTCFGANNGTATANVSNGTPPYSYSWNTGDTTATITGLSPGSYTVSITDDAGCPLQISVSITGPTALQPNASATPETGVGRNDGTATAAPVGGTPPYTYQWSNGQTTPTIVGLAPGAYTVTVQDANGCTAVQTVVVNAFNCNLAVTTSATPARCPGEASGAASAIPANGTAPITYQWSNGGSTATIVNLSAGVYTVTATDAAGCQAISTVTVSQPALPDVRIDVTPTTCPESKDGRIVITVVSGGTPPYTFSWPGGTPTDVGVGTYVVTITDANGCLYLRSVTVTSNDVTPPTLTCPPAQTGCADKPVQYPAPTFSDNCALGNAQPKLVQGLPSGSIFPVGQTLQIFELSDASSNKATCSFTVTVGPPIVIALDTVVNDVGGAGRGRIRVSVSGGVGALRFEWTKDNQPFASRQNLDSLNAGRYVLTVTDENGCTRTLGPVVVDNVISTRDLSAQARLRVLPNPAAESIRLEIAGIEPTALRLLDARGQWVQTLTPTDARQNIAIAHLPPGLYYLQAIDAQGQTWTTPWVKQ